jgi:hypothetical protein
VHRHATRVIASVLQALQALHEDGNDVAERNGADDATHESNSKMGESWHVMETMKKYPINILIKTNFYFINLIY